MYSRVRKLTAVYLCMVLGMMNIDIYAAEENTVGIGIEETAMELRTEIEQEEELVGSETEERESAEDIGSDESETGTETMSPTKETEDTGTEADEYPRTENTETDEKDEIETGEIAEGKTEIETTETETTETETTETETTETETTEIETAVTEDTETDTFETETIEEEAEESIAEMLSELQDELDRRFEEDGYAVSGVIDSGFEADRLTSSTSAQQLYSLYADNESLPESYSAVANGQGSSVKNQGAWGTCWAFSALVPAEIAFKKLYGSESDLSETHLVNFFYHDNLAGPDGGLEGDQIIALSSSEVKQGGNAAFTAFALSRWTGVADEALDQSLVYPLEESYNTNILTISDEYAYLDVLHMQNAYWINKEDHESIKREIMDKGAVTISYKYSSSNDSRYVDMILEKYGKDKYDGPAVYYYQPIRNEEEHGVSIVGWDDNFDRDNFAYTFLNQQDILAFESNPRLPENNGAWLVKNSWGAEYGDEGYFWMSYEDASLSETMFSFDFEKANNYDHIYQYDGSAGVRYESGDTITAAAVYNSTGNQIIEAVGVGIASVETDYIVEIYTGLTDLNDPQSGILSSRTAGTSAFQGYHTIKLDEYVTLANDDFFSIVVTLSNGTVNGEDGAAIFVDRSYDNGSAVRFIAKTRPGETFCKSESGWQDAVENGTYRIKAYTRDGDQEDIPLTPEMVKEISGQAYNGGQCEPDVEINYMGERLVRDVDYSVSYANNTMVADRSSENAPRVIVTGMGKYTGTVERTFTIFAKEITLEMVESATLMYNGTIQDDLVLRNGGGRLVKGTDYDIVFSKPPCNAGSYTANITGTNNYAGQISVQVTMAKTVLSEEMIGLVKPADGSILLPDEMLVCEYTGAAVKPVIKVMANGAEVPSNNYSVSYKQNTTVGTGTITVTGKGNCQGKVTRSFEIIPRSIESGFTVSIAKATYSGKALTPAVTVKWDKKTLKKGRDYTIAYEKNIQAAAQEDAEAPKVTVTGIGNYTGIIEQTFTILPKEIAEGSISIQIAYDEKGSRFRVLVSKTELVEEQDYRLAGIYETGTNARIDRSELTLGGKYNVEVTLLGNYKVKNKESALKKNIVSKRDIQALDIRFTNENAVYTYNAKAQKPALTITDADGKTISSANYTLTYTDNINAGVNTAKVTVTGKGAYAGTCQIPFTIEKKKLDASAIQPIKDQTYSQKELCPAVRVLDGKKALKAGAGKDYTCLYGSNIEVAYDADGIVTEGAYVRIQLSDNYEIDAGAEIRYFKIKPAAITSISLSSAYYTGQAVTPDKIVVKAGKLTVPEDCYEIAADNNIQVSSKASLTITAKGTANYIESKTKKYSIVKRELKKLMLPVIPDQPYLKQPITVDEYCIKDLNGQELGKDQYDVTVKNNNKVGKATVTYKAKSGGIYKGSAVVRFNITKATVDQAIDHEAVQPVVKQYTGGEITLTDEELWRIAPIKGAEGSGAHPYTAAYSRNINAGTAVVCLTGTDYLQGSKNVYFTIVPKSADSFVITTGPKQLGYNNGSPVYLELKEIRDNDTILKAGKDFTYSYINADKKGIACLTVTGVGNYSGTRFLYYNIG